MNERDVMTALICHRSNSLLACAKCPFYNLKRRYEPCHVSLFNALYDLILFQKAEIQRLQITRF